MNITGVVVDALPGQSEDVESELVKMNGVEVHAVSQGGRMVVTVEGDSQCQVADALSAMNGLGGVLSAALVYHSFEQTEAEA